MSPYPVFPWPDKARSWAARSRSTIGAVVVAILVAAGVAYGDTPNTTVTVTPSTNLPNSATVSVGGSGFSNNTPLFIYECHRISGEDCFLLKVHVPAIEDLEAVLDQTHSSFVVATPVPPRTPSAGR